MATERIVRSLKVKCRQHDCGCDWVGELRAMKVHNDVCEYQQVDKVEETKWKELQKCREELYAMKEKVIEFDVLREKVVSSERLIKQQERDIADLTGKVERLQRLVTQKENTPPIIPSFRRKRGESSGACANPRGAEENSARKRKCDVGLREPSGGGGSAVWVTLRKRFHRSILAHERRRIVEISNSERNVKFCVKDGWATVMASFEPVPAHSKVWYEILFHNIGEMGVTVGWCSEHITLCTPLDEFYQIGNDAGSYGFRFDSLLLGRLCHDKELVYLTDEKIQEIATEDILYVGVALDMVTGEILFSVNGTWTNDTFTDVPVDVKLTPAITGSNNASIEVNFGEKDFMYAPPNPTFQSMKDIL